MRIAGTARVNCPHCGARHDCELVQSINTRDDPATKQRLLAGELNVLACSCGKRTQLIATLLFHDPVADYFCQVCPGGEAAMAEAALGFRAAGTSGTQRLVPTQNALVEKVKLLDAGLADWAIEMTKVLLLAPGGDLDRVLLFERADDELLHWVRFDDGMPVPAASPRAAYAKLAESTSAPPYDELQIDRAWAVLAVQQLIAAGN